MILRMVNCRSAAAKKWSRDFAIVYWSSFAVI